MNNRNGIILMIVAMAGFTLEDLFIKLLSSTVPLGQILVIFGIVSTVFFALMSKLNGHRIMTKAVWTKATITRMVAEAIAAVSFMTSLSLVPISTVAAVFQVTPLAITMGAALFLGEQVGWRRWLAIGIGFMGVLLIIKPGVSGFNPHVLWVLVAVLGVTLRDLITRVVPEQVASSVISFQAYLSLILAGIIFAFNSADPFVSISDTELLYFIGGIAFGIAGYYGIVSAMRIGDTAVVSPFRYMRLLFSLLVGIIVFKENIDLLTVIGSIIVIGTGLYTFLREHRLSKERPDNPNLYP